MQEFEDLQKQLCEQLQIIAELRQETIVSPTQSGQCFVDLPKSF